MTEKPNDFYQNIEGVMKRFHDLHLLIERYRDKPDYQDIRDRYDMMIFNLGCIYGWLSRYERIGKEKADEVRELRDT